MATLENTKNRIDTWINDELLVVGAYASDEAARTWGRQGRFYNIENNNLSYMRAYPSHNTNPLHSLAGDGDKVMERFESAPDDSRQSWSGMLPEYTPPYEWPANCRMNRWNGRQGKGFEIFVYFDYEDRNNTQTHYKHIYFNGLDRGVFGDWRVIEVVISLADAVDYLEEQGWRAVVVGDAMIISQNGSQYLVTLEEAKTARWPDGIPRQLLRDLQRWYDSERS